jgi:hypothetical protein
MSLGIALVFMTVLVAFGWWRVVNLWRSEAEPGSGAHRGEPPPVEPRTAAVRASYAALVAFMSGVMLVVWSLVINEWLGPSERVTWVLWWFFVADVVVLAPLGASLHFFLRPRFLVPPNLREAQTLANARWRSAQELLRRTPRNHDDMSMGTPKGR